MFDFLLHLDFFAVYTGFHPICLPFLTQATVGIYGLEQSLSGMIFLVGSYGALFCANINYRVKLLMFLCTKIYVENKKTAISTEAAAAYLIGKLDPASCGQKGVKVDHICIEASNDNKVSTLFHNQLFAIFMLPILIFF